MRSLLLRLSPAIVGFQGSPFLSALLLAVAGAVHAADAPAETRKGANRGNLARGQAPSSMQWWREIDTGPFISDTILTSREGNVAALKGIAIKLGAARDVSVVFDTELLAWRAG